MRSFIHANRVLFSPLPAFIGGRGNLLERFSTAGNLPPRIAGAWRCVGTLLGALVLSLLQGSFLQAQPLQQGRLQITVTPLLSLVAPTSYSRGSSFRRMSDKRRELGTPETQMYVVEVEISNATERIYILEVDRITLRTVDQELVKPIHRDNKSVPSPALARQPLAPGAAVKGYLYYPAGSYIGARGFLSEEHSHAREGFSIRF